MDDIYRYAATIMIKKRKEQKWTQQQLADYCSLSRSFIRDIENDRIPSRLNLGHINTLASESVFNCSPKDFLPDRAFE
jgi:transcriptional regulator with XRE-family HTH domain